MQLFVNVGDVFADGMDAEVVFVGNFFITEAVDKGEQNLFFACSELVVFFL